MSPDFMLGMAAAITANAVIVLGAAWRMTIQNERRFTRLETLLEGVTARRKK